jgi:hypothetical protein
MMEMNAQTLPAVNLAGNTLGSERRSLTTARTRRQRARDLADRQLCMFFDFETLESPATSKPEVGAIMEPVYSTPRLRVVPVYKESVEQPAVSDRVHVLDRTEAQCAYPMWSDDERDLSQHFACGAAKSRTATYCCSHMALAYGRRAA